jgi:hypothetical protein
MGLEFPEDFPPELRKILGDDCVGVAEFRIVVSYHGDLDGPKGPKAQVVVLNTWGEDEPPFAFWMALSEYLIAITAKKSNAGFEKALELLVQGAMTYKDTGKPIHRDEDEQ